MASDLASIFDASITIITGPLPLDSSKPSFNDQRIQWNSDKLLHWLAIAALNNTKSSDPSKIILGICNFDADSSGLVFVFGKGVTDKFIHHDNNLSLQSKDELQAISFIERYLCIRRFLLAAERMV